MKILAQTPTDISAVATVLLRIKTFIVKSYDKKSVHDDNIIHR